MVRKGDRDLNTQNFVPYQSMGNNICYKRHYGGVGKPNKKKKISSSDDLIISLRCMLI